MNQTFAFRGKKTDVLITFNTDEERIFSLVVNDPAGNLIDSWAFDVMPGALGFLRKVTPLLVKWFRRLMEMKK